MRSAQRRIIAQYVLLSSLANGAGIALICGTYVSFLKSHGLTNLETNLVNAMYFLSLFIFEIPTGAFADVFGRKKSFIASKFILAGSMFIYAGSSTIVGFLVAEIIGAIGRTFATGAFKAWMVDSLKHHGYHDDVTKIEATESVARKISSGIGAILGSLSTTFALNTPWLIGGFGLIISGVIACIIMDEDYFIPRKLSWKSGWESMKCTVKTSYQYSRSDKKVKFVIISSFIFIMSIQAMNMYWQPVFEGLGMQKSLLGFVFALIMISTAIGAVVARKTCSRFQPETLIVFTLVATGMVVLMTGMSGSFIPALSFFMIHELGRGMIEPLLSGYMHNSIPSSERATISSFCEMSPHIGGVIGLVGSGIIAQSTSIECSWIVSGVLLIVGMIVLSKNK